MGIIKDGLKNAAAAAAVTGAVMACVRPIVVRQSSMEPTLKPDSYLIMNRLAYAGKRRPKRSDIIIFRSPLKDAKGTDKLLIKRVIGLPGERIEIRGGDVYIDGREHDEPYTSGGSTQGLLNVVVPEGSYFVLGDNRSASVDSRRDDLGCVAARDILGQAVCTLFPFSEIGSLTGGKYKSNWRQEE